MGLGKITLNQITNDTRHTLDGTTNRASGDLREPSITAICLSVTRIVVKELSMIPLQYWIGLARKKLRDHVSQRRHGLVDIGVQ